MPPQRPNCTASFSWKVTRLFLFTGPLVMLRAPQLLAQGCAMCQTVLPQAQEPMARGMFWSMLLLLSAPFTLGAAIGGWLIYQYRKANRARRQPATIIALPVTYTPREGQS